MNETTETKSRPVTLIVQLVVIPLGVVAFCVGLGALFMWLTSERKDFDDYLGSLRSTRGAQREQQARYLLHYIEESKRWQGIFDVTAQITADREAFLARHPQAVAQLIQVFEESATVDPKTRRYLALVLGLMDSGEAVPVLRRGLDDSDPETVKNCLWALGRLKADEAAPRVIELTRHDDPSVRSMAVYVLGALHVPEGHALLVASLRDPDDLVQWNAAFALARQHDGAGRAVLERLLDKGYVDRFTDVTVDNRSRYRVAAVQWLAQIDGAPAAKWLAELSAKDADLRVRNAALRQLNGVKQ